MLFAAPGAGEEGVLGFAAGQGEVYAREGVGGGLVVAGGFVHGVGAESEFGPAVEAFEQFYAQGVAQNPLAGLVKGLVSEVSLGEEFIVIGVFVGEAVFVGAEVEGPECLTDGDEYFDRVLLGVGLPEAQAVAVC